MSVEAVGRTQVAVLGARGQTYTNRGRAREANQATRVITFAALALYGTLKWSNLLGGAQIARLVGLLLLAVALAGCRPLVARRSRLLAALGTAVAVLAVLPIAGVPFTWLYHVRIAVTARAIGKGLTTLPQVLVPYSGANHSVTLVMVLGAGVLLFDAALLVAFAPPVMQELRRAGAALPLVALAAVPTTLLRPRLPYLDGVVLFVLLVAFMWGERIGQRRAGGAIGIGSLAVVAALFVAPALDRHHPWINYRNLAGSLRSGQLDGFNWAQGYGRIDWPRNGRVVLEVRAQTPEYWKAENMDVFNGVGWENSTVPDLGRTPPPDPSAQARWTQPIRVTIRDMSTLDLIGAGATAPPFDIPQNAAPGLSPGTWRAASPLGPGDSYVVSVYAPNPSPAQLAGAGPVTSAPAGYLTVDLPRAPDSFTPDSVVMVGSKPTVNQPVLLFPPFHSSGAVRVLFGRPRASGLELLNRSVYGASSPYGNAYGLARQLAAGASTPYQFVEAVKNYLASDYTYNENPPAGNYPLETFLFSSHRGYCQQFAGAMALLLRMGGVPARVATGFTQGRQASTGPTWLVTDYDAHAWVEVWFPHYGWVRFDPTPSTDPALSDRTPIVGDGSTNIAGTATGLSATKTSHRTTALKRRAASQGRNGPGSGGAGGGSPLPWIASAVGVALLALLVIATKPLASTEGLVEELEAALRRLGRPLPAGATLTWLERRVAGSADAVAYIRRLRLARFGDAGRLPTRTQRRALRRQLRRGLGPVGVLRAAWALPPRWGRLGSRADRGSGA